MGSVVLLVLGAFTWDAPDDCPPQAELERKIGAVQARVSAQVRRVDGHFELTVTIDDQVRTVTTASCSEAADTAVFLIELASDRAPPRRVVESTAPPLIAAEAEPPLVKRRAPEPERVPEATPPTTAPAPATGKFHLGAVGGAEWILLPEPVARFGLFGQADVGPVRLTLEVRAAPSMRLQRGPTPAAVVVIAPFFDAQAGLCRLFAVGPLQLGPCAQGGVGVVWATGLNVQNPRGQGFAVWTAGGGARAAISVTTHLEVQAFAMLRFGSRPRYLFGGEPVVETAVLGIDSGLGIGARW